MTVAKDTSTDDRRKHARILKPIDGRWLGGGAGTNCRLLDLSAGGCFVQSLSSPAIGDSTSVVLTVNDGRPLTLNGTVVHIEARIGFSVQFTQMSADCASRLATFIDSLHHA
jgi:hypothetical protein